MNKIKSTIVPKVLKILGFIKRVAKTFSSANRLRSLYFSLVRSKLEWVEARGCPYLSKDQLRLDWSSSFLMQISC